jgi:hypothetical protein
MKMMMEMRVQPAELALRTALANPEAALAFLRELEHREVRAEIAAMSDAERDYVYPLLAAVPPGKKWRPSEEERSILAEMRELREAGKIPKDHREYRKSEGWWGFLDRLRCFARGNGLPRPAIDHMLGPYLEWRGRRLFERYGLTATDAGVPLADWDLADREDMLAVWELVRTEGPVRMMPGQ